MADFSGSKRLRPGASAATGRGPVRHRGAHARFLLLALLPPVALTQAIWTDGGPVEEGLEWLGYVLVVACVLGRAWCGAYIAGRKNRELVDRGPYSVTRNPLYAFSTLGLTGIGLQTGSLTWAALILVGCSLYFGLVVRREEAYLLHALPDSYGPYLARTPRWLPDASLWRDVGQTTIRPTLIARTLLDGACFLAAYPLLEALGDAHASGLLPGLLSLP